MPIDYELMGEIEQEMGSEELPELEAMPEDGVQQDGVQQGGAPEDGAQQDAGDVRGADGAQGGEELPELEAMPEDGVQQDGAQHGGAPEDGAQQDAGDVRSADGAQGASGGMPVEALALLGAQDQAQAMQMLEDIAVAKLVESGVPDAAAREIVALRKQVSAGYPRDAPARTQAAPAAQAAPAEPAQGAQDQAASPTVERMARQIDYIRERTGVDMLEELRRNPDMLGAVAAYADGRGGMDIMGAYDALRAKRASGRARVPKSIGSDGGGASGAVNVGSLTDAQMEDIDRRVRAGERITF